MNNLLKNLIDFFGFDGQDGGKDEDAGEPVEDEFKNSSYNSKVVDLNKLNRSKVVVYNINTFNEVTKICDNLRQKKISLINMEKLSHEESRRVLDFVSGACYSLDGNIQKIDTNIFIVCPHNIEIIGALDTEDEI
jgi:Protein of unknown function (DUF552).